MSDVNMPKQLCFAAMITIKPPLYYIFFLHKCLYYIKQAVPKGAILLTNNIYSPGTLWVPDDRKHVQDQLLDGEETSYFSPLSLPPTAS